MSRELVELRGEIEDAERHLQWAVENNVRSVQRRVSEGLARLYDEWKNLLSWERKKGARL